MKCIKIIKGFITLFFLLISFFIVWTIFSKNFAHEGLVFSADSWTENQFMIILNSTWMAMIAVLGLGIISVWINFVFIRIIYNNEIREAAVSILRERKEKQSEQYTNSPIDIFNNLVKDHNPPFINWNSFSKIFKRKFNEQNKRNSERKG